MLNLPQAALLSAIQLACTLVLTVLYQQVSRGKDMPLTPVLKGREWPLRAAGPMDIYRRFWP